MKKTGLSRLTRLITAALTAAMLIICAGSAGSLADGGCDPMYMQALRGRANMEAKRESAQNKNLIYKQDSVLEYSCIFSMIGANQQGTSIPVSAAAWDHEATTPTFNYLANSFGHVYLGGHFPKGSPNLPAGPYLCDAMARMYEFARCLNFNQFTDAEGFFDFSWYESKDPRTYPPDYQTCEPIIGNVDLGNDIIQKDANLLSAFNGQDAMWTMDPNLAQSDNTRYGVDQVKTYLNLTSWDTSKGGSSDCGPAIPTGLTNYRKDVNTPDYICAKPGCTLSGTQCVK